MNTPKQQPEQSAETKRGRGRPSIGKPVTTRLSEEDHAFAVALGDGIDAMGIRRAVKIAFQMGIETAKYVSRNIENPQNDAESQQDSGPKRRGRRPKAQTGGHIELPSASAETDADTEQHKGERHGY